MIALQLELTGEPLRVGANVAGLVLLSGVLAVAIGAAHRWYARDRVPEGLAILVGVSGVAAVQSTTEVLGTVIDQGPDLVTVEGALFNVGVFALAVVAAAAGGRVGDRLGQSVVELTASPSVETDVSEIVRTVGRVTTVELPSVEEIGDIEGYDSVESEVKSQLAGRTFRFPRRLTVEELRKRLVERLRADYGIGYVDVELDEGGSVEYLAVGSRESGIGPTLPPGSAAVAIRADPAVAASAGDIVQVYRTTEEGPERVCLGEVRGVADDVVTLAVDAAEATSLDEETHYRLVTLPVEPRPDREFAALLRAAEETMGVATVLEGGALVGVPVGSLDVAVAAVRPSGGPIESIPPRSRTLSVGDTLYAVARPARLRRLEAAAAGEASPPLTSEASVDD